MPSRSIPRPFLYKQAVKAAARLQILHKFCQPQCRLSDPPTPHPSTLDPLLVEKSEHSAQVHFLLGLFIPAIGFLASCHQSHWCCSWRLKSLPEAECLHCLNQRNADWSAGWRTEGVGVGGGDGEESPCHFLCPTQERFGQRELACFRRAVMSAILGRTAQCATAAATTAIFLPLPS